MDFSKLAPISRGRKPTDPFEIFEKRPSVAGAAEDLWRGQTEALGEWTRSRTKRDVLIGLNTGAGKTLVGLLIAQSLVNEGVQNVIYVCATIDLVEQTAKEAQKLGLDFTTRTSGEFSNDAFESGHGFCITTYHALFNGLSALRRRFPPGAVIFDDAHVAEGILCESFLMRISNDNHPRLFRELTDEFRTHFSELGHRQQFNDTITGQRPLVMMAAPSAVRQHEERLLNILNQAGVGSDEQLKYAFAHLADHLSRCAILFSRGICEITPPFLPALALDVFERRIRRVYLSATLQYKTDFVRAFGRLPEVLIEPRNDAGNGERLILFSHLVKGGVTSELANNIKRKHKLVVAVPTYGAAAKAWGSIAKAPERNEFTTELNRFRHARSGAFVLVSRVDGIDLPHEACRVMIMDGLPAGSNLIDRFQWEFLNMRNAHALRISNRIVQLFGRINRGRNDYGCFLISGRDLNTWLRNDRYIALMPYLLQQQIALGRYVQQEMEITRDAKVLETIDSVLSREASWLALYRDNIERGALDDDKVARADAIETRLVDAALAEARFAKATWENDLEEARLAFEETIENTARADAPLAGWHNVWLGSLLEEAGDNDAAAFAYRSARLSLGSQILLPKLSTEAEVHAEPVRPFAASVFRLIGMMSHATFLREVAGLERRLKDLDRASPRQMEEAVRALGELLGFEGSRPDNDVGTGPDVLWEDTEADTALAFELKTDKQPSASYSKKDIGQGHDHVAWVAKEKANRRLLGLGFVGPDGACTDRANPSPNMWIIEPRQLAKVRDRVLALIRDMRKELPLDRLASAREKCGEAEWTLDSLFKSVRGRRLDM
jgi:hypothetical protein